LLGAPLAGLCRAISDAENQKSASSELTAIIEGLSETKSKSTRIEGLSKLLQAARGDFIQSWDINDALRAFSGVPQELRAPIDRAENQLSARAPGLVPKTAVSKSRAKSRKAASTAKAAPAKAVKVSLQSQVDAVSKRLVAADKKTQRNIAALEADFTALAAQMKRTKAGQTQLARRVTTLSNTLSKDLENLQSGVKQDLTQALRHPTLDGLQAALERAENRLSESETAQDTAIMRINRHIADIATIVEARLSEEAQTREAAMAEMKRLISTEQTQILAAQSKIVKTQSMQYPIVSKLLMLRTHLARQTRRNMKPQLLPSLQRTLQRPTHQFRIHQRSQVPHKSH